MSKATISDVTTSLCGALTDLGCQYSCDIDNRGGNRSTYIHITRPLPAKIRISDHRSSRIDRDKGRSKILIIDVDVGCRTKGAVTWQEAVAQIAAVRPPPLTDRGRD